jgi:N-acetylglutamate synthase-like GNAT family acetyltransferase
VEIRLCKSGNGNLNSPPMNPAQYRVRRATLDDMSQLSELWKTMHFPPEDLSKRVTEFQVAESPHGTVVGALGLQIAEKQGRIHSECFSDFSLADGLRPMLWDRVHAVATNHGLLRLWTQENAPFWNHCGLNKADAESMSRLPASWRNLPGGWLTLKLKDDVETLVSLDKEFSAFMESEKARTQRAFQHARILKVIATLIALAVFGLVIAGAFILLKSNPRFVGR